MDRQASSQKLPHTAFLKLHTGEAAPQELAERGSCDFKGPQDSTSEADRQQFLRTRTNKWQGVRKIGSEA